MMGYLEEEIRKDIRERLKRELQEE
jgi:hypothetical protein